MRDDDTPDLDLHGMDPISALRMGLELMRKDVKQNTVEIAILKNKVDEMRTKDVDLKLTLELRLGQMNSAIRALEEATEEAKKFKTWLMWLTGGLLLTLITSIIKVIL